MANEQSAKKQEKCTNKCHVLIIGKSITLSVVLFYLLVMVLILSSCTGQAQRIEESQMSPNSQAVIDFLRISDFILLRNEGDGSKLFNEWKQLYEQGRNKGYFPLIIVPTNRLVPYLEGSTKTKDDILGEAKSINAVDFLTDRLPEWWDSMAEESEELPEFAEIEAIRNRDSESFSVDSADSWFGHHEVIIAKVPTENPWELAAWIPMGGWNNCPTPAEQVAVFRHWYERYGAVPALVTHDIWDLYVHNPPETEEEALHLAKEMIAFCEDIAEGGVSFLALWNRGSKRWGFWWD